MIKPISKAVFMLVIITAIAIQCAVGSNLIFDSNNFPDKHLSGVLKGTLPIGFNYIVDDAIYVKKGDTLFVEAGVTLNFKNNKGLEVKGKLIAKGEESKKIVFTCLVSEFSWRGISFLENAPSPDFAFC